MNTVGHLQSYPVLGPGNRTNYEEDLAYRIRQGYELSEQEIVFILLMQSTGEPDLVTRVQLADVPQPVTKKAKSKIKRGKLSTSLLGAPNEGAASSSLPTTTVSLRATGHVCVICLSPIFGAEVRVPCGHFYDISCINALFQAATRNESLYPPRCCQVIPLHHVQKHLTQTLLVEFKLKAKEFGTLKRVYCAAPECSRFLGSLARSKPYSCPSPTCATKTCGNCRMKYEPGHHCAPDAETERVLTMSHAFGWTRCPGCAQMIELDAGCNHIICRCKTDFCYVCCARWKTCACPVWDNKMWFTTVGGYAFAQLRYTIYRLLVTTIFCLVGLAVFLLVIILRAVGIQSSDPPRRELMAVPPSPAPFVDDRPSTRHTDIVPAAAPLPFKTVASGADAIAIAPSPYVEATVLAPHAGAILPVPRAETIASASHADAIVTAPHGDTQLADDCGFTNTVDSRDGVNTVNDKSCLPDQQFGCSRKASYKGDYGALRVRHGCQHTTWERRSGGGMCVICTEYLPNYLFRCEECEILCCGHCQLRHL